LPDLSRIATQVAAKGRAREGRSTGDFHVRSFAILLRRFSPSRRSLGVACIFESLISLVLSSAPMTADTPLLRDLSLEKVAGHDQRRCTPST